MGWEVLWDPFGRLRGSTGPLLGAIVILFLAVASVVTGALLDGALDLHLGPAQPTPALATALSVIDWLSLVIGFVVAAAVFGAPTRALGSYLWMLAVARWPMALGLVASSRAVLGRVVEEGVKLGPGGTMTVDPSKLLSPALLISLPVILLASVWTVTLCVFAVKRASGLKGGKLAGAVVVGIVLAEILSKMAILAVVRFMM